MIRQAKRYFNTSGPNDPRKHYTIEREALVSKGIDLVDDYRYFTIWAPRQSGKTTFLNLLADALTTKGYEVLHINVENFASATEQIFLNFISNEFKEAYDIKVKGRTFPEFYDEIKRVNHKKRVFIVDEVEGLNPDIFGQFLHTIRNLYHFREEQSIKSVILVGVSNIIGVTQDNASPFNIADNLEVPYFTTEETRRLLHMHEEDTGQRFDDKVKEKISSITANQPGLVNGFAYRMVQQSPQKEVIDYDDFLKVEDWYLTEAIDKNISNVINKAKQYRRFVEQLLYTENKHKFKINDEKIKFLHTHGLLKKDSDGNVEFWVPIYKKAVFDAFYPYSNGESDLFFRNMDIRTLFYKDGRLKFDKLIENYRAYVKRRSFRYFREKDPKTGKYKSIKEAALAYSFETYIQTLVQSLEGKSYLEPHSGLGISDLIININNREYVVEFKIFRDILRFEKGKKQIASYCKSLGVDEGVYLVFVPNTVTLPDIKDQVETIDGIEIRTYTVFYDEEKEF